MLASFKVCFFMILLCGFIYPAVVTSISQIFFYYEANGSLISCEDHVCGSKLIAQNFNDPKYFKSRPSSGNIAEGFSSASQLSPISKKLHSFVTESNWKHPENISCSGSGLDPHLSPEALKEQVPQIAAVRNISEKVLYQQIEDLTEKKELGLFGQNRVNVFYLNKTLDLK